MNDDILIRRAGRAGRITLNRPDSMNAMTADMVRRIDAALALWAGDDAVEMVILDGAGERAFCAGGDLLEIHESAARGDFGVARRFWQDEYRMNARIAAYPKPVAAFLHGYTLGGGVGLGCHASHRIACENSQIGLPETGIGLVPDVGGSLLLARAPGRLGEFLATTAARMDPADAILAGFADLYIPQERWPDLVARLERTADRARIDAAAETPPEGELAPILPRIDAHFAGETLGDIWRSLRAEGSDFTGAIMARMARNAPLAMAASVEMIHRLRGTGDILKALELEYRYVWRAIEQGDFLEGIRAMIVDRDRTPRWRHDGPEAVPAAEVGAMLRPLGAAAWHPAP